jgi:hypothetical protein
LRKISAASVFRRAVERTLTTMRRARGFAGLLLLWAAQPAGAVDDAAIYALIDTLRPTAEAITVDGNPADWGAIPAFADPSGDAGGDPLRDITRVRIAPTANALYVLIQTAGAPSTDDWAFWIRIDFTGEQFYDVELAINDSGNDGLSYMPEDGCTAPAPDYCSMSWEHATVAIGSVVEVRIPYAELDAVLPPAMQGKLSGSGARPFLRVQPHTVAYPPPRYFYAEIDDGSAVGSYRLVTTPYSLDSALPAGGSPFTAVPDPMPGLWYVGQGSFTHGSHTGIWGYDLQRTDNALHIESPVGSTTHRQLQLRPADPRVRRGDGVLGGECEPRPSGQPVRQPERCEFPVPRHSGQRRAAVHTPEAGNDSIRTGCAGGGRRARRSRRKLGLFGLATPAFRRGHDPRAGELDRDPARPRERARGPEPHRERSVAARRPILGDPRGILRAARAGRRSRVRRGDRAGRTPGADQARSRRLRRASIASNAAAASPSLWFGSGRYVPS